jgi:hypothetical protein
MSPPMNTRGMPMICRSKRPFLRNPCAGVSSPEWASCCLVTPRLCRCVNVCVVGPVATAVHPVHPPSRGGGRGKSLKTNGFIQSVHPSTQKGNPPHTYTCAHTGGRVSARARACAEHPHLHGRGGRLDGYSNHAGLRRPPLRPPLSTPLFFSGASDDQTSQPASTAR